MSDVKTHGRINVWVFPVSSKQISFLTHIVANSKSALKRIQIAERNRLHNKSYKSAIKTLIKRYTDSLEAYASEPSSEQMDAVQANLSKAFSKIDKAVKTGVLHRNTGARRKARLSRLLKKHAESVA